MLFSTKSATSNYGDSRRSLRRSIEKLPNFRSPRKIFFKALYPGNPDDPSVELAFFKLSIRENSLNYYYFRLLLLMCSALDVVF